MTYPETIMEVVMRTIIAALTVGFIWGMALYGSASADVASLRGAQALDADAVTFDRRKQVTKEGGFARAWKLQPPAIPHKIDKDRVTLQENSCMKCHSEANYKKEKAPRIGDSHFIAADGSKLQDLNMRRYFCNQCHVPQVNVEPLIENTFKKAGK